VVHLSSCSGEPQHGLTAALLAVLAERDDREVVEAPHAGEGQLAVSTATRGPGLQVHLLTGARHKDCCSGHDLAVAAAGRSDAVVASDIAHRVQELRRLHGPQHRLGGTS
jgi:hypothetical protein